MNPRNELQRSIYRELNDGTYKVFTELVLNEPYPYIRIDSINSNTYETKTTKGYQFTVTINSFSDSTSDKEVSDMAYFIEKKLKRKFDIEGFHNIKQDLISENDNTDSTGTKEIKQINQEYTFIIIRKEAI